MRIITNSFNSFLSFHNLVKVFSCSKMRKMRHSALKFTSFVLLNRKPLLILLILFLFLFLLPKTTFQRDNSIETIYRLKNRSFSFDLSKIYENQWFRYSTAAFLPTFENDRFTIRFNVKSIVTELFGENFRFDFSIRRLKIFVLTIDDEFRQNLTLNFDFNVKKIDENSIDLTIRSISSTDSLTTFISKPNDRSLKNAKEIFVDFHRKLSRQTKFSFFYFWNDEKTRRELFWPQWPLDESCEAEIRREQRFSSCSTTSKLKHLTSEEIFEIERNSIRSWLNFPRRSTSFERFSNSSICSNEFQNWILNYRQWHSSISSKLNDPSLNDDEQRALILKLNVRFLIYEKHSSGNADRFVHLISTYLIAVLTRRFFLFDDDWPEFSRTMRLSLNAELKSIVRSISKLNKIKKFLFEFRSKDFSSEFVWFGFNRLTNDFDYNRQFPQRILRFRSHTGATVRLLTSNSSIYRTFFRDELKIDAERMFGCLFHSFIIYRLSALIEATSSTNELQRNENLGQTPNELLQTLLSPKFYPIGIQIRMGDSTMEKTSIESIANLTRLTSEYFRCAQKFVDENQSKFSQRIPKIFLLSDSFQLRRWALEKWKNSSKFHVIGNAQPVLHITYTKESTDDAFRLAMFDIFLFSLCEQHFISRESGFGRIGVFTSLNNRNIYSFEMEKNSSCQSISLIESGSHWSGI